MREITGLDFGPADDWLFLDSVGMASGDDDDDANFERWLASVTPHEFEQTLNALISDPIGRFADRTA